MSKTHVMIDLETMSTASNAAIVSIGACKFSVTNGIETTFYKTISLQSCIQKGLHVDGDTMMWWMKQSDDARKALQDPPPQKLDSALADFAGWMYRGMMSGEEVKIWGNGATFDNVILSNAFKVVKRQVPWKFRNDSCYRTIKNMFNDVPFPERKGTHHNALDDAIFQATHLIEIFKKVGVD